MQDGSKSNSNESSELKAEFRLPRNAWHLEACVT